MCCTLDQGVGRFIVRAAEFEEDETGEKVCHLKGIYDRTPPTLADRISRFFQRLELLEKIAEIVDESFHAFGFIFQRHASMVVYQTYHNLHDSSHHIEHILHSFCFLGDVTRLMTGKFFKDGNGTQLDYLRSASRVCHATAHFLATMEFLHDHQLPALEQFKNSFKYASALSSLGYALWTVSLIWQRHQGIKNENFAVDMSIHFGGFLFEAIPLIKTIDSLAPYSFYLGKATAIAGIIHAWFVVQRLMTKDSEVIETYFIMPDENDEDFSPRVDHSHHHHVHDHSHQHDLKFRPVKVVN